MVLAAQVQARFGVAPVVCYRRLGALVGMGLLSYRRVFHGEPGVYLATNGGLAVADVGLAAARIDLASYRHDLAAVWAGLAIEREIAQGGVGGLRVVGERELRSLVSGGAAARQVGLTGPGTERGRGRGHVPDVAVVDGAGRTVVAVVVELSAKGRARLGRILAVYARDRDVARVVYLADRAGVAASVARAARQAGAEEVVVVRRCQIVGQGRRVSIEGGPLLAGAGIGGRGDE
jgi:hypothetical protein